MKIKDVIKNIASVKGKMITAISIAQCSPEIKEAIRLWKEEEDFINISRRIETPDGEEFVVITTYKLVDIFGMSELDALLMIDEIDKAQLCNDRPRLAQLLHMLRQNKHVHDMHMTPEFLEDVKNNNTELWEEFQKSLQEQEKQDEELEKEYKSVIEEDI